MALIFRQSVKSPSFFVTWMCAFEPRIFSRRSVSKPLITESTQTSAPVPIHTPTSGTVVKNVNTNRITPTSASSRMNTNAAIFVPDTPRATFSKISGSSSSGFARVISVFSITNAATPTSTSAIEL